MIIKVTDVFFDDQNTMVVCVLCKADMYIRNFELVLDPFQVTQDGFWNSVTRATKELVLYDQEFTCMVGEETIINDIVLYKKAYGED